MYELINAFQAVFTIIVLVAIGFTLQKNGKINNVIGSFLSFFVISITLPCSVFKSVTKLLAMENINDIFIYIAVIILSQVLTMLLAAVIAKGGKISKDKSGTFITMTAFNNTLFMGMPVSVALFGEKNSAIIVYYYLASTILFWTVGIRVIAGKQIKKKIKIPPPIYGLVAGAVTVLIGKHIYSFEFPTFFNDSINYISAMTTPLSMIFTGYALGEFGLKNIRLDKSVTLGLFARFILSPAIFILFISLLSVDKISRNVFIVQAFMPVMASQTIIARQYGVDDSYPAVMVTVSTLLSLAIIPFVKAIITIIW